MFRATSRSHLIDGNNTPDYDRDGDNRRKFGAATLRDFSYDSIFTSGYFKFGHTDSGYYFFGASTGFNILRYSMGQLFSFGHSRTDDRK